MTMNDFEDKNSGQGQANNPDGPGNTLKANNSQNAASSMHDSSLGYDNGPMSERSSSIGQALKSVYQQTVEEELPEDFQKLLDQLK